MDLGARRTPLRPARRLVRRLQRTIEPRARQAWHFPAAVILPDDAWPVLDGLPCSFGTTFAHPDAVIHSGVYIGNRCTLGSVTIERDATIGSNVDILSGRRQHGFAKAGISVQQQQGRFERVRIGRNAWIGNSSVIMADVGDDCVIGAAAVVVKAIESGSIAVGNPAEVKRRRAA